MEDRSKMETEADLERYIHGASDIRLTPRVESIYVQENQVYVVSRAQAHISSAPLPPSRVYVRVPSNHTHNMERKRISNQSYRSRKPGQECNNDHYQPNS